MATKKYNWTKYLKGSSRAKGIIKHLAIVFMLLPILANAQMQNTPLLQDPRNNTVFSFYPFESGGFSWDHKNYFHSLENVSGDPYGGMWFRMMLPPGFNISDTNKKYPLILFFHGSGERGTTNYRQLVHGGQIHRDAVINGGFPGILLYPQQNTSGGGWPANGNNQIADRAFLIVKKLIQYYNVDPNRIYVHGLSGGGEGVWQVMYYYPELIAAALPMSAARTEYVDPVATRARYAHIPIWQSQGGRDTRPTPLLGNYGVNVLRNYGASIRYSFMPTTGHGTWTTMYTKPDFFSWMLQQSKTNIHVFYEQAQFCDGQQFPSNLRLGVTAGFTGYQWAFNSTSNILPNTGNEIIATAYGDYYVRINRGGVWSKWSEPRTIDTSRLPSPPPTISSGNASVTLPALDGSQSVKLTQTAGPTLNYQWYRDNITIQGATNNNYTVTQQGDFSLTAKSPATPEYLYFDYWHAANNAPGQDGILDPYPTEFRAQPIGCESTPSNSVRVTTGNGPNSPLPPKNFFALARSASEIELVWDDNSNNETGFEVYRSENNGANYTLITIYPAFSGTGSLKYSDKGLQSGKNYCYRIRSVNGDGGSPYSAMVCTTTGIDTTPPETPVLEVSYTTGTSISLSWVSTDNVGVIGYDLYRNGSFLITLTQNAYNNINLTPAASYTYYVIAKDAAGNSSTPSNQVTAATVNSGLYYKYYHFETDLTTVDQIESTTLIKAGKVNNFDISIRERDDRFAFIFEGYINIPTTGSWRFYPASDDGSKVFINGSLVYSNDGTHGCGSYGTATSVTLSAGVQNIKVLYFENGGGECLTVSWRLGTGSTVLIPNSAFEDNFPYPSGPNAPSNLTANAISFNQINLGWTDNSNDETGFELYRRTLGQSTYQLTSTPSANAISFNDVDLLPSTTYYYKILSRNNIGVSNQPFAYLNLNNDLVDLGDKNLASSLVSTPSFNSTDKIEGSHSLQFTQGSSQYINFDVGNIIVRKPFTNRSVAFWIRVSSLTGTQMIYDEGGSTSGFSLRLENSNLQLGVANGSSRPNISASFSNYINVWTHVVGIFKVGGMIELYINKNLVASTQTSFTSTSGITGQNNGSGIGGSNGSNAFTTSTSVNAFGGLIDNFMFFNAALTQADINYYYGANIGFSKAQTLAAPATPATPTSLAATPISTSQISPSWTDNSTNELGFEIYRATSDVESSYLLVATTSPDATTYTDSGLPGNTLFYYKIRAKGDVNSSSFTPSVSASPLNNPPVITTTILNRSVQIGTTLQFEVRATDPDLDVVTFSTDGVWPAFGSVSNQGQNMALVKFENPVAFGTYTLRLSATDGIAVVYSNTFTITVNNNAVPIITAINDQQVKESKNLTVNISASDDSGNVNLSAINLPSFATFNYGGTGGTANIVFSPAISQAGYYSDIQIIANDGLGGIAVESFNLIVEAIETSYLLNLSFDNTPHFSAPWNFIGGTSLLIGANDIWPISNLFTSNQSVTPITIDAVEINQGNGNFDNTYSFGTTTSGTPGLQGYFVVPDDVIEYGLASAASQNNKLIINGLEDILSYELNLMSSIKPDYLTGTYTTTFRINGISKSINPVGNATEFQRFVDVRPTNGAIEIEMLTSGGSRTMLNAFTVEAYYDNGTTPQAPSDLVLEALSSSSILVKWKDNSGNETDFDVYRRTESQQSFSVVGSVNKNIDNFIDQTGINGTTRYYYYVQARNKNGFANSNILDVLSLNASPIIVALAPFEVKSGQKTDISVSSSDYENDPIALSFQDIPPFVSFVDHGNGTGTISFDPDESVVGQTFNIELKASDIRGGISSRIIVFNVINGAYLQTVYLNLSQTGAVEATKWNNLTQNPANTTVFSGLKDGNGNNTTMGLQLSGIWSGTGIQGVTYPLTYKEEALFPVNVMNGYWYTNGQGIITFTGLDISKKYNISLFSSYDRSDALENINTLTQYSTGSIIATVDPFKNPNRLRKLSGLSPDATGRISISIGSLGVVRAVLNALIIECFESEQRPFAPTNILAEVKAAPFIESSVNPAPFHVELNWADNSGIESGFEIHRYNYETGISTLIYTTNSNIQTYTDQNLPRDKKLGYRIRAIGSNGVSEFASIVDAVIPVNRVLLNMNYNRFNVTSAGWNNTYTTEGITGFSVENLRNDLNVITDIGFYIVRRDIAVQGGLYTGVNAAGLYPASATKSFFHIGMGSQDEYQWFGLNDSLTYDLVFFASRKDSTGSIPKSGLTTYKVNDIAVSLNAWENKDKSVIIRNVKPNNGAILFSAGQTVTEFEGRWNVGFVNVVELRPISNKGSYPTNDFYYYAAENSNIGTLTNWFDQPDESGSNPASFNDQGLKYVISSGKVTNLASNLTIGGQGSKMILKDDVVINFTANNLTLNLPYLEIDEGASVTFGGSGLSTANINIGDLGLNIRNGATLIIGNAKVNVSGLGAINPTNTNGVIASSGGSISIVNTSTQPSNLYFADGTTLTSLKIDNSNLATLTVYDSLRITDKLEVTNGRLVTNGYIKLVSDATKTAMITRVGPTSTITGAVEYQRYWARVKGGYYYIGVPVQGQTLASWQTDFYIQGVRGSNPTYWTNVYTFNEPTNTWSAMSNVTNPVTPGKGVAALMFNSDFVVDGFIRYNNVGNPVYGTYRVNLTYTDRPNPLTLADEGWQLVANPYACAIDLNKISWTSDAIGLGSAVYLWNGATSIYETWNPSLGARAVASGQGFFVHASGSTTTPYIDFKESHKETTTNPTFLRTEVQPNLLTLKMINQDSVADNFHIVINESATFGFESHYDAFKYRNSSHNLYSVDSAGNNLAINSIPALIAQDTINLVVESAASKSYYLHVAGLESLEQPVNMYLADHYLNTVRLLNEGDKIPFAIDKNVKASFGRRISLIIGKPGVVKLADHVTTAHRAFKIPLSVGQLENVTEMNIEVRFNPSEFKLNNLKQLNSLPGLIVDETNASQGKIILTRNKEKGVLTLPAVLDILEFNFIPLVNKVGKYAIWIDQASWMKTDKSEKYAMLLTNATIDLRSSRKVKGDIKDLKGRPFNNAIVHLKSIDGITTTSLTEGVYGFDIIDQLPYDIKISGKGTDYSNPDLLDLVQLTRYSNGLEQIPSGQILYSSDLNNDGQVNNADLNQLQSLILSKEEKYPGKTVFSLRESDNAAKRVIGTDESSGAVSFIADNDYTIDFLALRKGEVYQNSNDRELYASGDIKLVYDLIPDKTRRDIMHVLLYPDREISTAGMELHFSINSGGYQMMEVTYPAGESMRFDKFLDNSDKQAGFIWVDQHDMGMTISENQPILDLQLKAGVISSLEIEDIITLSNSRLVGPGMEVSSINGLEPRHGSGSSYGIVQLYPNPAQEQLNIVVNAQDTDVYTCVIYSASGQIIYEEKRNVFAGINIINLQLIAKQGKLNSGYYIVRMEGSKWSDVKPFLIK